MRAFILILMQSCLLLREDASNDSDVAARITKMIIFKAKPGLGIHIACGQCDGRVGIGVCFG